MATAFPILLGKPLVFWLGLITGTLPIGTAYFGMRVVQGKTQFKNHLYMVYALALAALAHALQTRINPLSVLPWVVL